MQTSLLLKNAKSAAIWGYIGTATKLVLQFGVQVVLARSLGPGEYGLFALGVIVVSFAMFFGDVASSALVQKEEVTESDERFAFTWQLIVSFIISLLIFILSPYIAELFATPNSVHTIKYLAWICFINAFGGVSQSLLRRRLDFKKIQIAQLSGYIVGYIFIAIPYAYFYSATVQALIYAWLVQATLTVVIYFYFAKHAYKPLLVCADGAALAKFGLNAFITNISNWAQTNLDRIIVARYFSAHALGVYSTSANLVSTPLNQIYGTFQQVSFAAASKLEKNSPEIGGVILTCLKKVILFLGIGYGSCFLMADTIVDIIYGDKWIDAIPFVQAFSVVCFFSAISGVITPFLWAQGAIAKDSKIQFVTALVVLFGSISLSGYTALHIAWFIALIAMFRSFYLVFIAVKLFKIDLISFASNTAKNCVGVVSVLLVLSFLHNMYKV